MDCFVRTNDEVNVNTIYHDMKQKGFTIGLVTYGVLMKLYVNQGNCNKALELFDDMLKNDITPNESIYQMVIDLQIKSNFFSRAIALFKNMLIAKISPSSHLYESIINACKSNGKDCEGLEILMCALTEKIKIDNLVIDKLIENIIKTQNTSMNEKVEILSSFSILLKELNMQIMCNTYDKLSKFLFQNKTLGKLTSFSESSIYSTSPVNNTVTIYYQNNKNSNETSINSSSLYGFTERISPSSDQSQGIINKNPFTKVNNYQTNNVNHTNQYGNNNIYTNQYNNSNQYVNNNQYSNNQYNSNNQYYNNNQYGNNQYNNYGDSNGNYNNNTRYQVTENSLYDNPPVKSLYSKNGKDDLFGNSFKR